MLGVDMDEFCADFFSVLKGTWLAEKSLNRRRFSIAMFDSGRRIDGS
jgi:hypothetical protein